MTKHERNQLLKRLAKVEQEGCARLEELSKQKPESDEAQEALARKAFWLAKVLGGVTVVQINLQWGDYDEGMRKSVKTLEGLLNDDKT